MDYLDKNFPDLIFEHKDLKEKFILTKKDLFAFNTNNDSDKNLYFLILSGEDYLDWILGIPFLKNYVLSYNYDTKKIGYYEHFGKEEPNKKDRDNPSFFKSITFKIIIVILLIIIIFCLGMFFQKYNRKSRKKKANELDDDFEYESHKDKIDNNVNNKNENESLGINE